MVPRFSNQQHPLLGRAVRSVLTHRRRGVASALAMLYLVLFATLAVGFFAATTMSVQVSRTDREIGDAQRAAESGLGFARYQLAQASISSGLSVHLTFNAIADSLDTRLSGTSNFSGAVSTRTVDGLGNDTAYIPAKSGTPSSYNWISMGPGGFFRLVIFTDGTDVYVKSIGTSSSTAPASATVFRAVQMKYKPVSIAWISGSAGLMARGAISLTNGAQISGGDVLSMVASGTVPLTMSGGAKIDGNFLYSANSKAPTISNGAKLGGQIIPNAAATFPAVDSSIFAGYVPAATATGSKVITSTTSLGSNAVLTNIRIKANANTSFGNSQTLNGVIYIESPNNINFGGGMRINGIIVTDNSSAANTTNSTITIANGVRIDTLATLDPLNFVAADRITELKAMSGAIILAPRFKVVLAGGARSYDGAMVADQFDISNGYKGTISGGLISLGTGTFTMLGGGQVTFTGGNTAVPGLTGGSKFYPDSTSYLEVDP